MAARQLYTEKIFIAAILRKSNRVKTLLHEAISKGGEMSKEDLDMVKDWETEKNNYLT